MINERGDIRKIDAAATLECVGAVLCWSVGPIFVKYLTGYVDSWTQNAARYGVSCLFWLPFLIYSIRRRSFDNATWRRAIVPGSVNVIMQSFYGAAFYYIGPAFMILLSNTSVIWVAGFSLVFFAEERTLARSKRFWSGMALSILGAAGVLYFKKDFAAAGTITGVVLALGQAFLWAVYAISVRISFRETDSRSGFSVISIYTFAGLSVLAMLFGRIGDCAKLGVGQWSAIVISGVLSIALAHVLYYAAMRRIGATIPALVLLAQPFLVFAVLHIVFGESLSGLQLISGVVLLAGSALAVWAQQHLLGGA
jgi:drug/metabolite transporter (DMT)-like permease